MNEKYYAAYLNNEEQLKLSSSGGMAYAISEQIILSGGVVFGIRYSNDFFCAKYVKIDNLENLSLLNGSKYITEKVIDGVGVFKSVYNVLLNQRKVLFIGTPCDIGNLISFLKKNKCQDFDKLVTLDFICQGPIKAKVQKEYIQFLEHKYNSTLVDFSVRYKHPYWKPVYLRAVFSNGKNILNRCIVQILEEPLEYMELNDVINVNIKMLIIVRISLWVIFGDCCQRIKGTIDMVHQFW